MDPYRSNSEFLLWVFPTNHSIPWFDREDVATKAWLGERIQAVWPNSFSVRWWDVGKKLHPSSIRCKKDLDADLWMRNDRYFHDVNHIWRRRYLKLSWFWISRSCGHSEGKNGSTYFCNHFSIYTFRRYAVATTSVIWKWKTVMWMLF